MYKYMANGYFLKTFVENQNDFIFLSLKKMQLNPVVVQLEDELV